MTKHIEDKLDKIPVINLLVRFFKEIRLPGFEGLSIYDLLELYAMGILKGALTTRASAVAFSFFTAIFPFLLFVIIIMPYVPIDGFHGLIFISGCSFYSVINGTSQTVIRDILSEYDFNIRVLIQQSQR